MCTPQTLIKSDFWFADGNIVIVAGCAGFKVHRGQLERHSEVFNGLFSLPQPARDDTAKDSDLIEGCAWVEFFDAPEDVFYFLSALYDGMYLLAPRARDFPVLAGVLRLSTKYLVEPLRALCLVHMNRDWPTSLSAWDAREAGATDPTGRYAPRETCAHPILAITLALEQGVSSILPAALYDLSRYGPSKILAGAPQPALALHQWLPAPPSGSTIRLPHEFLCRTLRGREAAQRFVASFLEAELHQRAPAVGCTGPDAGRGCHESFYFIALNVLRSVGGIACGRDADPLFTLVQAEEMLTRTDFSDGEKECGLRICAECKREFSDATARAREEVWRLIPSWFGLEEIV